MRHDMIEQAAQFSRKRQRRRRRRKLVTCLGAAVVFCTTYALILPAITMESGYICGMAEHEHDETCFAVVEHEQISAALTCQPEAHVHTDVCFDEHGRVICGLSDRLLHRHDADCYFDGELICTLPEVTEHIHRSVLPADAGADLHLGGGGARARRRMLRRHLHPDLPAGADRHPRPHGGVLQ